VGIFTHFYCLFDRIEAFRMKQQKIRLALLLAASLAASPVLAGSSLQAQEAQSAAAVARKT
jgi:hypothetical protein